MQSLNVFSNVVKFKEVHAPPGAPPTALSFQDIAYRASNYLGTGDVLLRVQLGPRRDYSCFEGTFAGVSESLLHPWILLREPGNGKAIQRVIPAREIDYILVLHDPSCSFSSSDRENVSPPVRRNDLPGLTKPPKKFCSHKEMMQRKIDGLMEALAKSEAVNNPVQAAEIKNHFHGERLSLARFHPEIEELLVYRCRFATLCQKGETTVVPWSAVYHPASGLLAAVERDSKANLLLREIMEYLNGNELELDCSEHYEPKIGSEYWSLRDSGEVDEYKQEIHPVVNETVISALRTFSSEQSVTIVDILGGSGSMLGALSQKEEVEGRLQSGSCSLNLIDGDATSVREAQQAFAQISKSMHAYNRDVMQMPSIADIINAKPHIVTAAGGLTLQVLTPNEAEEVAQKVFRDLQPGGFFILSGYTPLVLNASDFSRIGFTVVNQSIPENLAQYFRPALFAKRPPQQLYVLRKTV